MYLSQAWVWFSLMKFSELQDQLKEKFGIDHLADIARELGVSPQAVSNWKARDRVPYKYVLKIRKQINESDTQINDKKEINKVLDNLHLYASKADGDKYFHLFVNNGSIIKTFEVIINTPTDMKDIMYLYIKLDISYYYE